MHGGCICHANGGYGQYDVWKTVTGGTTDDLAFWILGHSMVLIQSMISEGVYWWGEIRALMFQKVPKARHPILGVFLSAVFLKLRLGDAGRYLVA